MAQSIVFLTSIIQQIGSYPEDHEAIENLKALLDDEDRAFLNIAASVQWLRKGIALVLGQEAVDTAIEEDPKSVCFCGYMKQIGLSFGEIDGKLEVGSEVTISGKKIFFPQ